tara:strand:- start:162 stop:692 length:531 start_codon:yes stop_codon:yes gene_type:complete
MDFKSNAVKLQTLSREELKRGAKVLKLKGYTNKNKSELIAMIIEAVPQIKSSEYEAESAILTIREALGLSTSGNLKNRTAGLPRDTKRGKQSPKQIATEAMASVREAMDAGRQAMKRNNEFKEAPKLRNQFVMRMKKEMADFEKELDAISSKQPAVAARKTSNKRYKDSAKLKQDV